MNLLDNSIHYLGAYHLQVFMLLLGFSYLNRRWVHSFRRVLLLMVFLLGFFFPLFFGILLLSCRINFSSNSFRLVLTGL